MDCVEIYNVFLFLVRAAGPAASLILFLVLGGEGAAGVVLVLLFVPFSASSAR